MLTRCEEIMRKVCEDFEAELKEFNGERDHVHLLIEYPPKGAVSKLVNSLKGVSVRRIRQEFTGHINRAIMHGHLWSPSYFSSCGGAPLAIVRQYIEQHKRPL
jgi:putative transposase